MTRRRIESLNISRSQEGAAEGIFRFDSKAKMMMKKLAFLPDVYLQNNGITGLEILK